jgi:beta-phosphoglucomutase-like phosphatase (HAD superfamily)
MCYIVEDSPKGLKAAVDSGANIIAVKNSQEVNIRLIKEHLI